MVKSLLTRMMKDPRYTSIWELFRQWRYLGDSGALDTLRRSAAGDVPQQWFGTERDARWDDLELLPVGPRRGPADVSCRLGTGERMQVLRSPVLTGLGDEPAPWTDSAIDTLLDVANARGSLAYLPHDLEAWEMLEDGGVWRLPSRIRTIELSRIAAGNKAQLIQGIEIAYPLHTTNLSSLTTIVRDFFPKVPLWIRLLATTRLEEDVRAVLALKPDVVLLAGVDSPLFDTSVSVASGMGLRLYDALLLLHDIEHPLVTSDDVSLVVAGSVADPADVLRALHLGADACMLPVTCLWAFVASQFSTAAPLEPPMSLVLAGTKMSRKFKPDQAAESLASYLSVMRHEIAHLAGELGMQRLHRRSEIQLFRIDQMETERPSRSLIRNARQLRIRPLLPHPSPQPMQVLPLTERHLTDTSPNGTPR